MPDPSALADAALALRGTHRHAPALDVLDGVMCGVRGPVAFGALAVPPAPFALVVADAFDGAMSAADWAAWMGPDADPVLRAALLQVWWSEVWPRFVARHGSKSYPNGTPLAKLGIGATCGSVQGRKQPSSPTASPG